jgi:type II secretory pathway component PulF
MVTPAQLTRRAELYHQLGSTIAAGVPLIKALQMSNTHQALKTSQRTITRLIAYLQQGYTLKDSLRLVQTTPEAPDTRPGMEVALYRRSDKLSIPDFDVALISVGEETGRLDVVFKLLAQYYTTKAAIVRDTITGLLKPLATLNVLLLVFPLGYLVDFFWGIYNNDYSKCYPFIIEKLGCFGTLYGTIFFAIYACQGTRSEKWRSIVESIGQIIPILRNALKNLAVSRLTASLESLMNAGVPVIKSWDMAAQTSGSPALSQQVQAWTPQLENGMTPADMVQQIGYFPEMFVSQYTTAELSGNVDETLIRLRDYYQDEGFRALKHFTRTANSIVYGLIMFTAAAFIMHFWINYYHNLVQTIQNS